MRFSQEMGTCALRKNLRPVLITVTAQSLAVALGWSWGFVRVRGVSIPWLLVAWLLDWNGSGAIAVLAFFAECLHYVASSQLRRTHPIVPWLCLGLALYSACIMLG